VISDSVNFLAAIVLYVLAVGGVKGFAFTLGLTTLVDLLVVFLFTHPMVALLARTKFFGGGHKLSGFDAAHLGRDVAYKGRGRVRSTPKAATAKAETIAERRARQAAGSPPPEDSTPPGADQVEDAPASTGGNR
jgi:preprotein translocase subunit SecD